MRNVAFLRRSDRAECTLVDFTNGGNYLDKVLQILLRVLLETKKDKPHVEERVYHQHHDPIEGRSGQLSACSFFS